MITRRHMCQSIRGPLKNWSARQWTEASEWITRADGSSFSSGDEVKAVFERLLREGIEVMPYGDCDNFDPVHGCLGHPIPEAMAEAGI